MAKKRIPVLGGGFAGVYAARALRRRLGWEYDIEPVNDVNYFVFQHFLPGLATRIRVLVNRPSLRSCRATPCGSSRPTGRPPATLTSARTTSFSSRA